MICAIAPLSMAHQWRKGFAPLLLVRLRKNQWRIGCAHWVFLTAHQWRDGARNAGRWSQDKRPQTDQRNRAYGARWARDIAEPVPTAGGRP